MDFGIVPYLSPAQHSYVSLTSVGSKMFLPNLRSMNCTLFLWWNASTWLRDDNTVQPRHVSLKILVSTGFLLCLFHWKSCSCCPCSSSRTLKVKTLCGINCRLHVFSGIATDLALCQAYLITLGEKNSVVTCETTDRLQKPRIVLVLLMYSVTDVRCYCCFERGQKLQQRRMFFPAAKHVFPNIHVCSLSNMV